MKNRPNWVGFCFYKFLSLASKIALTSPANSSKLAPKVAAKPITKVIGFFNTTQRRVLAHVSWGVLKKPNECAAFV